MLIDCVGKKQNPEVCRKCIWWEGYCNFWYAVVSLMKTLPQCKEDSLSERSQNERRKK